MVDPLPFDARAPLDVGRIVYRWDLDKTYLRTEFDTLRDILRTAFESAKDKRAIPGATMLLRELRRQTPFGIFILSGSPEQMRRVLEAKLRLDGVEWDGLHLKPQLRHILRGRFRFLRDQVGYKLAVLLHARSEMPEDTQEYMFGDDAEADAFIYSLYADLGKGLVPDHMLRDVLVRAGVYEDRLPFILNLASKIPKRAFAKRIFIHLDRVSAPSNFAELGSRVVPFYNYFQPALILLEDGAIPAESVLRIARELLLHHAFDAEGLVASYSDLVSRKLLGGRPAQSILTLLADRDLTEGALRQNQTSPQSQSQSMSRSVDAALQKFATELERRGLVAAHDPQADAELKLDYADLYSRDRARAVSAKLRSLGKPG